MLLNVNNILQQQRKEQQKLKIHEKTTYASRVNAKTVAMRKIVDDINDDDDMDTKDEDGVVKDDPQFTLTTTRGPQYLTFMTNFTIS